MILVVCLQTRYGETIIAATPKRYSEKFQKLICEKIAWRHTLTPKKDEVSLGLIISSKTFN